MTSENLLNLEKVGQLDAVELAEDLLDRMMATTGSQQTPFDLAFAII